MGIVEWVKSTFCSGGECVEVAEFQASSPCTSHDCVEVGMEAGGIAVRDSKDKDGPHLHFTREEFAAFVKGVKAGEFDHYGVEASA